MKTKLFRLSGMALRGLSTLALAGFLLRLCQLSPVPTALPKWIDLPLLLVAVFGSFHALNWAWRKSP